MLTGQLLPLLVPAWIITLAIAVSAQAPPATTSSRASDSNLLTNKSAIEMVPPELPQEVVITKNSTLEHELRPVNSRAGRTEQQWVSASVVMAVLTPKNALPRRWGHKPITKEET